MSDRARLFSGCALLLVGLALAVVAVTAPTGGAALGVVLAGACLLVVGGRYTLDAVRRLYGG